MTVYVVERGDPVTGVGEGTVFNFHIFVLISLVTISTYYFDSFTLSLETKTKVVMSFFLSSLFLPEHLA